MEVKHETIFIPKAKNANTPGKCLYWIGNYEGF